MKRILGRCARIVTADEVRCDGAAGNYFHAMEFALGGRTEVVPADQIRAGIGDRHFAEVMPKGSGARRQKWLVGLGGGERETERDSAREQE